MIKCIKIDHQTVELTEGGRKVTATLCCDDISEAVAQGSSTEGIEKANLLQGGDELAFGSIAYDVSGKIAMLGSDGQWKDWG